MDPKASEPATPSVEPVHTPPRPQPSEPPVPVPLTPKPVQASSMPMDTSSYAPAPRRFGRFLTFVVILIALVVAAAGAGAAYMYTASGEGAISGAISHMETVPKMHVSIRTELSAEHPKLAGASAEVINEIDRSAPGLPRTQTQLSLNYPGFQASAEAKFIDPIIYGRINTMPDQYKAFVGDVVGRWYSVSLDVLKDYAKDRGYEVAATTNARQSISEVYKGLREAKVVGEPVFTGIKKTERGWVREYSILVDKSALADYTISKNDTVKMSPMQVEAAKGVVRESLDKVSMKPLVIQTGLVSGRLIQAMFTVDMVGGVGGVKGVTVTVINDETKADFTVDAPQNVTSLDEILLMYEQTSKLKGQDARIRAALSNARSAAEIYYDKAQSYMSLCTKDATIKGFFADIKSAGSAVTCRSTAKSYLMAAKLMLTTGTSPASYACIDSTGLSATLSKIPTGYVCK